MGKIIGIVDVSFQAKDGSQITGKTFHTLEQVPQGQGVGERTDHFFLSSARLAALTFKPALGVTVEPLYSKFGKVTSLVLVDPLDAGPGVDID